MDTQNNSVPNPQPVPPPATPGAQKNVLMAVLCYLSILIIVPFVTAKQDPFVKFHIKQGGVLFAIGVAVWILGMAMYQLWMILQLVNLGLIVLSIIGIINAVQGQEKELPLVGQFSKHIPV